MQLNPDNLATEFSRKHATFGLILGKRGAVLDVLQARGFAVSEQVRERIDNTTDLDQLSEWVRKAATIKPIDELFED